MSTDPAQRPDLAADRGDPMTDDAYDENGVDRSLIRWMLSLSPTERLAAVQSSIDLVASVRKPDGAR